MKEGNVRKTQNLIQWMKKEGGPVIRYRNMFELEGSRTFSRNESQLDAFSLPPAALKVSETLIASPLGCCNPPSVFCAATWGLSGAIMFKLDMPSLPRPYKNRWLHA